MKFCVKCGKGISEGVFCSECSDKGKTHHTREIVVCACGRILHHKRWTSAGIEKALPKELRHFKHDLENAIKEGKKSIEMQCNDKTELVTLRLDRCKECQTQSTQSFQGILQVRTRSPEVQRSCSQIISSLMRKKDSSIVKIDDMANGADIYFSDKRHMKGIAEKISALLGGTASLNPQLFSRDRQKSRNIYRLNILLELPHFSIGDAVDYDGVPALIAKLGKQMRAISLITGRKISLKYNPEISILKKHSTTISKTEPQQEVIHPETFQSEPVKNPVHDLKQGENVKVVLLKGVYLV